MDSQYPWYSVVQGSKLEQGDLFFDCPLFEPDPKVFNTNYTQTEKITVPGTIRSYNIVVLSQSCDLEQGKLDFVLVCPHWELSAYEQKDSRFRSKSTKNEIRKQRQPAFYMLDACDLEGFEQEARIVSFRQVFSLPFTFVQELAERQSPRLRLMPPYRESLAQAFARFFMRIGLPKDIPEFK